MNSARIYARQSEDVPEGIERQLDRCRKLAEQRGFTVIADYQDNATKASRERGEGTGWAQMLAEVKPGDVVLSVDVDRLLRSQRDLLSLIDAGARVLTVDGEIDLASADGEFRATMMAALARFEIRRKGERQKRANASRFLKGLPMPGKRRFGFEPGNVAARPDEAATVLRMFEHVAAGGSVQGLAKQLGMRPIRVRETLTNPSYAGWIVHHGERTEAREDIARIVPRDLFEDVQMILTAEGRKTSPGPQRRYLLSGLAQCGVCGAPVKRMRAYICSESPAHVWVPSQVADRAAGAAVRAELARRETDPTDADEQPAQRALRAEKGKLLEQRSRAQKIAMLDGADLDALASDLKKIGARIAEIDHDLEAAALEAAASGIWNVARSAGLIPEDASELDRLIFDDWIETWNGLSLEQRRALVSGLLDITINTAKRPDLDRIVIAPKGRTL